MLLTRRPGGVHLAGRWEFPGGKIAPGESVEQAARRETAEEIGVSIGPTEPLATVEHRYRRCTVRLHAVLGRLADGQPVRHLGVAGHRWVPVETLPACPLPAANGPITAAVIRRLSGACQPGPRPRG